MGTRTSIKTGKKKYVYEYEVFTYFFFHKTFDERPDSKQIEKELKPLLNRSGDPKYFYYLEENSDGKVILDGCFFSANQTTEKTIKRILKDYSIEGADKPIMAILIGAMWQKGIVTKGW